MFKIQIHNNIVKSGTITNTEFVVIGKLIQKYYSQKQEDKSLTININHKDVMFYLNIKDNKTFIKALNGLYEKGIVENEIENLPRRGLLQIVLNEKLIISSGEGFFTQMDYRVFNKAVIDKIGHAGVRLLYYYESFINRNNGKHFSFVGMTTIEKELGITKKTIIKHNKIMEELKFIKIEKHKLENTFEYDNNDRSVFTKYNNHYYIRQDKINEFCEKKSS